MGGIVGDRSGTNNLGTIHIIERVPIICLWTGSSATMLHGDDVLNICLRQSHVVDGDVVEGKAWVVIGPIPCLITTETDVLQVGTLAEETHLGVVRSIHFPFVGKHTVQVNLGILSVEYGCIIVPTLISQPVGITMVKLVGAIHILSICIVCPTVIVHLEHTSILASEHREGVRAIVWCGTISHE